MTANDIGILTRVLAPFLREDRARLTALEAKIAALEQSQPSASKSAGRWEGIHQQGRAYGEASLCTRSGSLWIATRATAAAPGSPDSGWQMVVKSGSYRAER